jgi:hypothetical protein
VCFKSEEYHSKWGLIRRLVLRRAGNRCEWGLARQHRPNPRTGSRVDLAIAHLDRDRRHNRFHNLAALCQRGHLAHDRPQHLVSRRDWHKEQFLLENWSPACSCELTEPGPCNCCRFSGSVPKKKVRLVSSRPGRNYG